MTPVERVQSERRPDGHEPTHLLLRCRGMLGFGTIPPHARGLECEQDRAVSAEEPMRVGADDGDLVWLRDVRVDPVGRGHEAAVLLGRSSVRQNGEQVGVASREGKQANEGARTTLYRDDLARRPHEIRYVRSGRAVCRT